jgi:hypothetical protein
VPLKDFQQAYAACCCATADTPLMVSDLLPDLRARNIGCTADERPKLTGVSLRATVWQITDGCQCGSLSTAGIPLGRKRVDLTKIQEGLDAGLSRDAAIDAARGVVDLDGGAE